MNADTWSIGPISLSVPLFDGGRAVANEFTAAWHGVDADEEMLAKANDPSDPHSGVVYAGEAVGLVHGTHSAGDVVRRIGADAERLLSRFA